MYHALLDQHDEDGRLGKSNNGPQDQGSNSKRTNKKKKNAGTRILEGKRGGIPTPRGFVNQSNYCYLNSIMQSLFNVPSLRPILDPRDANNAGDCEQGNDGNVMLRRCLSRLYCEYQDGRPTGTPLDASAVMEALRAVHPVLRQQHGLEDQEDAEEMLRFLLEAWHWEHLPGGVDAARSTPPSVDQDDSPNHPRQRSQERQKSPHQHWQEVVGGKAAARRVHRDLESPVNDLFLGSTRTIVHSSLSQGKYDNNSGNSSGSSRSGGSINRREGERTIVVEPFYCLPVNVDPEQTHVSLEDALQSTFAVELVPEARVRRQTTLEHGPPVLILHLRRIIYRHRQLLKVTTRVDLPYRLPRHSLGDRTSSQAGNAGDHWTLRAVIYHHGRSAYGGHYSCAVNVLDNANDSDNADGKWFLCDDRSVQPTTWADVHLGPASAGPPAFRTPYLLFYEQIPANQ
jgi:ubiquitin C-terminal hydrolase